MLKKTVITLLVFVLFGAVVFGVGALGRPGSAVFPEVIGPDSLCPVVGCAQTDGCHAASPPPEIDGTFEMLCPKIEGCAAIDCHASERLVSHYNKPSDSSMNLWILAPVVLVVGLVALVKKIQ